MKVTNAEIMAMWRVIAELSQHPFKAAFVHGLLRNKKLLRPLVEQLEAASAPVPGFQRFEQQRVQLTVSCCELDDNGQPVVRNGQVFITEESKQRFTAGMEALTTEYGEEIEAQRAKDAEVQALMAEQVEIDLAAIPLSTFPDGITLIQMEALDPIIVA